jgi:hypothetical protein
VLVLLVGVVGIEEREVVAVDVLLTPARRAANFSVMARKNKY